MSPRAWRSAAIAMIVTVVMVAALAWALSASAADIPASGVRLTSGQHWRTCVPRMIGYRGQYRIENDLFAGKAGRLCLRSTGDNLTVTTNVRGQPGGVVAAPGIRVGQWYGSGDPLAPFPLAVRHMQRLVDHVMVGGRAAGQYLIDTDTYWYPSLRALAGPPGAEVVIANMTAASAGRRLRIGHRTWYADHWITCPGVIPCHPIIVLRSARPAASLAEVLPAFVWRLRQLGWLPSYGWIGNTCLQAELWSGGRGLRLGLTVVDTSPVIKPLG